MEFNDLVKKRSATRKFSDKVVSDEVINSILSLARFCPTAKNMQPQFTYVVKSKEGLSSIDKASPCRYNAPVVLLVCSDKEKACKLEEDSTYLMDASIYGTYLLLASTNMGVDTIWVEYFNKDILREEFNLPSNMEPICIIPIGYKAEDCPVSPNYLKRKELKDTVKYI